MKQKILCAWVIVVFVMSSVAIPIYAGEAPAPKSQWCQPSAMSQGNDSGAFRMRGENWDPPGELLIADALVLRPLGVVASAFGVIGATFLTFPWAYSSDSYSWNRVERKLIREPFDYTFCRPMGDVDP